MIKSANAAVHLPVILTSKLCHAGCVESKIHPDDTPLAGLSCMHRGFIVHRTTAYCHLVVQLQSPDYLLCRGEVYRKFKPRHSDPMDFKHGVHTGRMLPIKRSEHPRQELF
jgi:hypothetical protein